MMYLVQDLSERMWLVDEVNLVEFVNLAECMGFHQAELDELSLSRAEQESLGDELAGDDMWQMNGPDVDYPVSWRVCPDEVADALMMVPVTPAEMQAMRNATYPRA